MAGPGPDAAAPRGVSCGPLKPPGALALRGDDVLRPWTAAAAALGVGLRALAVKLKEASAILLGLLAPPPLLPPVPAGVEASLRSALHLCARVHDEEVLPAVASFSVLGGGSAQDWARALRRGQGQHRPLVGDRAGRWPRGGTPGRGPPRQATDKEVAALPASQGALLRSLAEAGALALRQSLAAHLCACSRLWRRAQTMQPRGDELPKMPWELAPWRCRASSPSGPLAGATSSLERNPDERSIGSPAPQHRQQLRQNHARGRSRRLPNCWHGNLQPGYILCDQRAELDALVQTPTEETTQDLTPESSQGVNAACSGRADALPVARGRPLAPPSVAPADPPRPRRPASVPQPGEAARLPVTLAQEKLTWRRL